jgi:hypothetical protein
MFKRKTGGGLTMTLSSKDCVVVSSAFLAVLGE